MMKIVPSPGSSAPGPVEKSIPGQIQPNLATARLNTPRLILTDKQTPHPLPRLTHSQAGPSVASLVRLAASTALRAAEMPLTEALAARVLQVSQGILARYPTAPVSRVSRLALELELRGLSPSSSDLDKFLRRDNFLGDLGLDPLPVENHSDGGSGEGRRDRPGQAYPQPSLEGNAETLFESLGQAVLGTEGQIRSQAWHWAGLEANEWCSGGGFRWAEQAQGTTINLDLDTKEGRWQFHWVEPQRNRLVFASPPEKTDPVQPDSLVTLLEKILGPLGFTSFYPIHSKDWYDGFNFLSAETILRHIDMVV